MAAFSTRSKFLNVQICMYFVDPNGNGLDFTRMMQDLKKILMYWEPT